MLGCQRARQGGHCHRPSELSQAVSKVVRPGRAKDLLAGTWLGHPVHPMLTDVPIGAWTSAFVLDLFGGRQARRAADALVGVGVLAAVPTAATGLSDLADVEHSQQRILGTAHALGNVTAVALYGGSFLARRHRHPAARAALAPSRSGPSSNDASCPTPVEPCIGGRRGRLCRFAPTRYVLTGT
jgi:hypothetical protein